MLLEVLTKTDRRRTVSEADQKLPEGRIYMETGIIMRSAELRRERYDFSVLANIYLHELDEWLESKSPPLTKACSRHVQDRRIICSNPYRYKRIAERESPKKTARAEAGKFQMELKEILQKYRGMERSDPF